MRINKQILRLYGAFTALEAFRLIYLRLCFWVTDRTGLLDKENGIFILSCAAILAGMTVFPLVLDKTKLGASSARITAVVRAAAIIAGAAAIASYFAVGYAALAFQFITMLCVSGAMSAALRIMSLSVPGGRIGRFFGLSQITGGLLGAFLFFSPFWEAPTEIMLVASCALIALAAVCFNARYEPAPEAESERRDPRDLLPKRIVSLALTVMLLYAVVGGLLDNLYFFDDAFTTIPNFMFWVLIYAGFMNVGGGWLFDRAGKPTVAITAFVLVCLGQSMVFFTTDNFFGYLYFLFSNGGSCVLELFLLALPIAYCGRAAKDGKKPGILPGLGYILLYGSFFLSSVLFEFIPEAAYMPILGATLIVAVAAILVTFKLSSEQKAFHFARTEKDLTDRLAAAQTAPSAKPLSEMIAAYGITNREMEVLDLLVKGMNTVEIAEAMTITDKSVRNYVSSLMSKTGASSRGKMIAMVTGQKP